VKQHFSPVNCCAFSLLASQAQYGLTDEVHQLGGTIRALRQKLAESQ